MDDLIDRDALLKDLQSECPQSYVCISDEACIDCIVKRQASVNRWRQNRLKRSDTMMMLYAPCEKCKNPDTFGMICVKCGECGREFNDDGVCKNIDEYPADYDCEE